MGFRSVKKATSLYNSIFILCWYKNIYNCTTVSPFPRPTILSSFLPLIQVRRRVRGPWLTSVWGRSYGCCVRSSTPTLCSTPWRSSLLLASSYPKSKVSLLCRESFSHELKSRENKYRSNEYMFSHIFYTSLLEMTSTAFGNAVHVVWCNWCTGVTVNVVSSAF